MERLARLTGADILSSVDAHLGSPKLGVCSLFRVTSFSNDHGKTEFSGVKDEILFFICIASYLIFSGKGKTLMIFEGCRYPELGCTILLRGGTNCELARVKKVTSNLLFAKYNAQLEVSFLAVICIGFNFDSLFLFYSVHQYSLTLNMTKCTTFRRQILSSCLYLTT